MENLIQFTIAAVALTLMPGPDILFVLTESIAKGAKWGISIAAGLVSGLIVHTTVIATGLGLLITQNNVVFDIIKYAGAMYLLYLAYGAYKDKPTAQTTTKDDTSTTAAHFNFWQLFKTGFVMNILNPKVTLFFLAFFPGFVPEQHSAPTAYLFLLGFLFMVQAFCVFTAVSLFAGQVKQLIHSPKFWQVIYWMRLVVLVGLAIAIILT